MVDHPRGRVAAEEKLVAAAASLLGEVGPRATSVRMIAERAGVNHGLGHHYFGGKDALLRAAMVQLVEEHRKFARERSHGQPMPAPLALNNDQRYLRAVVRAVLDGEMELARTELDTGASVPRSALEHVVTRRGLDAADIETKATFALFMAMEMGWAAIEPFLFAVTDVADDEVEDVRAAAARMRVQMSNEMERGVRR